MYWMIGVITACLLAVIGLGAWLHLRPPRRSAPWWGRAVGINLVTFVVAEAGLLLFAANEAAAQTTAATGGGSEITIGMGLAILGAGLPTAFSTIGAGIAIGPVGSSAMAAIAERPEAFGRTLVYLGLAEGIAIYGLVISILLWTKI